MRSHSFLFTACVLLAFASASHAQSITPTARNGALRIGAGPLFTATQVNHLFTTPVTVHDSVSLSFPGAATVASSSADATLDVVVSGSSLSIAITGQAQRGAVTATAGPAFASSSNFDQWTFTLARTSCVRLHASVFITSSSNIATQGFQLVASSGGITLSNGQHVLQISGNQTAPTALPIITDTTATLIPGTYTLSLQAYVDANGSPYAGSVNSLVSINICTADFNCDGAATVQDIFDFLSAWFLGDSRADSNGTQGVNVQDIFDFLAAWFAGC